MFPGVVHMVEDVCPGQARQQTDPELAEPSRPLRRERRRHPCFCVKGISLAGRDGPGLSFGQSPNGR